MKQLDLKEYLVPKSLGEALSMLGSYAGSIGVIAGGTDIFTVDNKGLDAMLDVSRAGFGYIRREGGELRIGSCATYRDLIRSADVKKDFAALWDASVVLADATIRNIATVGGNICSAVPSGDAIPPMYAADAVLVIASKEGERLVKAEDFFLGPRRTVLAKGELLKEFRVPLSDERSASAFEKIARNSVDLANANVAVWLRCADSGVVEQARIALGAVAPTVVRARAAEEALIGEKFDEAVLEAVAAKIPEAIAPITNIRSTKEYRTEIQCVLTKKALARAYAAATA